MTSYPTNITDMQWQMITPYINLVEREIFKNLANKYPGLRKILEDGRYREEDLSREAAKYGWELSVVLRPEESPNSISVIPKQWIVELSIGLKVSGVSLRTLNSFPNRLLPC